MNNRAFTLLELLVVVTILLILSAFIVNKATDMSEQAKIAETRYILNKVAEAIHAFEQDWGHPPDSLEFLVNANRIRQLADRKGVDIAKPKTYWDHKFDEDTIVLVWSANQHNSGYKNKHDYDWIGMNRGKTHWSKVTFQSMYVEWMPWTNFRLARGGISHEDVSRMNDFWFPICDAWGNPILYFRKTRYTNTGADWQDWEVETKNEFLLFSAGPDECTSMSRYNPDSPTSKTTYGKRSFNFHWFLYNYNYIAKILGPPLRWKFVPLMTNIAKYQENHEYCQDDIWWEGCKDKKTQYWT
jgi:prepilin-type N-terminal cleavage/methylation domain-containing protein